MDNTLFDDCNCNGVSDADDIAGGESNDINSNGVPDECECLADLNGSGDVGEGDVLLLLGAWGTDPDGPPDLNGDGTADGRQYRLSQGGENIITTLKLAPHETKLFEFRWDGHTWAEREIVYLPYGEYELEARVKNAASNTEFVEWRE